MTARTYTLGAIIEPDGTLYGARDLRYGWTEDNIWWLTFQAHNVDRIADLKARGYRFTRLTATEDKSDDT